MRRRSPVSSSVALAAARLQALQQDPAYTTAATQVAARKIPKKSEPGCNASHRARLAATWPWAPAIATARDQIDALPQAP